MKTRTAVPGFAALLLSVTAAASVPWQPGRFQYTTQDSTIAQAMTAFSAAEHIPVSVAPGVAGWVSGRFDLQPRQFLDVMASTYQLAWYYDGAVLHITPAAQNGTLAMRLNYARPDALLAALDRLHITDPRYPLRTEPGAGEVVASGPPRYLELIGQVASKLEHTARRQVPTEMRIFRLHHADAADLTQHGAAPPVPGAATLLAQKFETTRPRMAALPPNTTLVQYERPLPIIQADAGTNSILVMDTPDRLAADSVMVQQIDTEPRMIALETIVADVDSDVFAALPIHWQTPASGDAPASQIAVEADAGAQLLAALNTLSDRRKARIFVRRTALTVDGAPAVLDQQTYQWADAASLGASPHMNVSTGLSMRVVPTVDGSPQSPDIRLKIQLDGATASSDPKSQAPIEASADVPVGQCLAVSRRPDVGSNTLPPPASGASITPSAAASSASRRLILLIPRLAAS